jgi:ubiquitin C-terminal hydrolase
MSYTQESMFGLKNHKGSCWVNAGLQTVFRIPQIQERYESDSANPENPVDVHLQTIWKSKGQEGLLEFFSCIRSETLPAGQNVGDTHELIQSMADKLPILDTLCRFKIGETIKCNHCPFSDTKEDSVLELSIHPSRSKVPITECIANTVTPYDIPDWKCEKCSQLGCKKQLLIGSFPEVFLIHSTTPNNSVEYSSVLLMNKRKYVLMSVACYNGSHWWAYARDMPPGNPWYTLDDMRVHKHSPTQFPLAETMKLLVYYRLDE